MNRSDRYEQAKSYTHILCVHCRLADLEAGGKDKVEFMKWREEMAQRDAAQQKAAIERRHIVSIIDALLGIYI